MSDTSDRLSCSGPPFGSAVTPSTGGEVKVKSEPLERPPLPPSPLIRLYETRADSPSHQTPEQRCPQPAQSAREPLFVTYGDTAFQFMPGYGMNYVYNVPLVYLPYSYQVPLLGALSPSSMLSQEESTGIVPYQCAWRAPQESIPSDDPVPKRDTAQVQKSRTDHGVRQDVNDTERLGKPTVSSRDEGEFRPLRSDSPRTIAYSYQRGMNDDRGQHTSAAGDSDGARITGVPVFIQAHGERSLLDVPLVDLFVAVSVIAGAAPSHHKLTSAGCLLVDMPSVEGVNRLLHCDRLCGVGVHASIPDAYQKSSSVIRDVPTSYTEGELLHALRGQGVIHVKRLTRLRDDGGSAGVTVTPTGKVVLTFRRNAERPLDVQLGRARYKLRDFMDRPARCFKCQRLGHVSRHCLAKQRCKRCCGHHDITHCPQDRPQRCGNCGGPHYPSYKGCPAYAEALKRVKSFLNVSE